MESLHSLLSPPRPQAHPSRFQWDRYRLQQLSPTESHRLQQHLQTCSQCQYMLRSLEQEQLQFHLHFHLPTLTHKVITAPSVATDISGVSDISAPLQHTDHLLPQPTFWQRILQPFRSWLWATASVSTAVVVIFFAVQYPSFLQNHPIPTDPSQGSCTEQSDIDTGIRRKGSPNLSVYLFRQGTRTLANSGSSYYAGDVLALRYQASGYRYLTVINLDAQKTVHWLYPSQPSISIPITNQGDLHGSIELDQAKGTEYILAFFSSHPLQAQDVAKLSQGNLHSGPRRLSCSSHHRIHLQTFTLHKP